MTDRCCPAPAASCGSQDTTDGTGHGISGTAEAGDNFGLALAAGNFNGTGGDDLAVGVPGEDLGAATDAGMVNVIYSGSTSGLVVTGNQGWTQDSTGISGTAETGDDFGSALVAGNFDGAHGTDLAIGVPVETLGTAQDAGMVNVIYSGGTNGLSASKQQAWSQASTGIAGTPETGDGFGISLAVGRIHSASRDDLIVGVPGEGIGTIAGAGQIQLIPSSSTGLTATGSQAFSANTTGVQGAAVTNGLFGLSLTNPGLLLNDHHVGCPRRIATGGHPAHVCRRSRRTQSNVQGTEPPVVQRWTCRSVRTRPDDGRGIRRRPSARTARRGRRGPRGRRWPAS